MILAEDVIPMTVRSRVEKVIREEIEQAIETAMEEWKGLKDRNWPTRTPADKRHVIRTTAVTHASRVLGALLEEGIKVAR